MRTQLTALREKMRERGIDIYIVPAADFHESEYAGDYFACSKYLTGFTGSAGTAVVTLEEAGLWTDGRYFLQAETQLADSGFTLCRMGEKGVPTISAYMEEKLPEGGTIGFDGRVINAAFGRTLAGIAEKKNGRLHTNEDLVGLIWTDRPALSCSKAWILKENYSGESTASKLRKIREVMAEKGVSMHVVTCLDDIAWILNLRGSDVRHCPLLFSYLILTRKGCLLYIQEASVDEEVRAYLAENGVTIQPYDSIYAFADALSARSVGKVLMNAKTVNYRLYEAIAKGSEIVDEVNPSQCMKACKNATEVQNIRNAHIKDGVALVKWLKWLKENVGTEPMTEISIADKLAECRAAQENFIDLSFDTICGYEAHGAIIHYGATQESNVPVEAKGLLLVDSGGHYLEGSTDITRTIVLGPVTEEQKKMFTLVLKGHFALASAKFPRGVTDMNLDVLAKKPLWDLGLDYRHGTGHGVGYLLNIHEGPNSFRWKLLPNAEPAVLTEGMITSDEPGYYEDGVFGIRHEDELLVVPAEETAYGEFLQFENLTYCPFDLAGIDTSLLDASEKKAINAYHEHIYRTLAPFLTKEEQLWLRYETREI